MKDIKNDYDYNKEIKIVQAKAEAKQLARKISDYRNYMIKTMNEVMSRKKVTHVTKNKDIEELTVYMTKLNRQAFIFRKMLTELKQLRKTLMKRKTDEPF